VKPSDEFASGVRQAALLDDTLLGDLRQAAQSEKRGSNEGR
jgi:hypothetical protein